MYFCKFWSEYLTVTILLAFSVLFNYFEAKQLDAQILPYPYGSRSKGTLLAFIAILADERLKVSLPNPLLSQWDIVGISYKNVSNENLVKSCNGSSSVAYY